MFWLSCLAKNCEPWVQSQPEQSMFNPPSHHSSWAGQTGETCWVDSDPPWALGFQHIPPTLLILPYLLDWQDIHMPMSTGVISLCRWPWCCASVTAGGPHDLEGRNSNWGHQGQVPSAREYHPFCRAQDSCHWPVCLLCPSSSAAVLHAGLWLSLLIFGYSGLMIIL